MKTRTIYICIKEWTVLVSKNKAGILNKKYMLSYIGTFALKQVVYDIAIRVLFVGEWRDGVVGAKGLVDKVRRDKAAL